MIIISILANYITYLNNCLQHIKQKAEPFEFSF